ncbi:hypothetical protein AG1IA_05850 [Rhizoctonia solani AG-1 IA]|uniref:Uncharacterized protein n=1 Tax=Thanatephorus cucumeris (strain AG1-IA) TaxID=983506 RepID=L8WPN1_THACA|nr:hypothetical protein AG1IA_05850 [Rhizoctonia solani AG-1 IA]
MRRRRHSRVFNEADNLAVPAGCTITLRSNVYRGGPSSLRTIIVFPGVSPCGGVLGLIILGHAQSSPRQHVVGARRVSKHPRDQVAKLAEQTDLESGWRVADFIIQPRGIYLGILIPELLHEIGIRLKLARE